MATLTLDTSAFHNIHEGFIHEYEGAFALEDSAHEYRTAHGYRLSDTFNRIGGHPYHEKRVFARPTIIGTLANISQGPDITASGVVIKPGDSLQLSVPKGLDEFVAAAHHVIEDVQSLYGEAGLKQATVQLIVQRTDIAPQDAHRKNFADWHTHLGFDRRRPSAIDLIYGFADALPTEFLHNGQEVKTGSHALTRFGAEYQHRSPRNQTDRSLKRTWGAFIVYPHHDPNYAAPNNSRNLQGPDKDEAIRAYDAILSGKTGAHYTAQSPSPLF